MKIIVNGKEVDIANGSTVGKLLVQLDIKPGRVVVERNEDEIISRSRFEEVVLNDGDQLEVLNFVGGGSQTIKSGGYDGN